MPTRRHEINGSRPPLLKLIGKSHSIKKTTSSNIVKQLKRAVPVIIYARSPKVIHTRAEDFMALVQRLTGLGEVVLRSPNDVSESSSVVTEEVNVGDSNTVTQRQVLADIPLFTPSSMTLFGSPTQRLYLSPNRTDSVFKFIKDFP